MYAGTRTERNAAGEITFRAEFATSGIYMPADYTSAIPLGKMINCGAIFDDGRSAAPYYAGGWNSWDTVKLQDQSLHWGTGPFILWNDFPVNASDARQFSEWRLGPRKFYHFKISYLIPAHQRPDGTGCKWSLCLIYRLGTRCPDGCSIT